MVHAKILFLSGALPIAAALLCGCHGSPKEYQANITIARLQVVHRDDQGAPLSTDIDIHWKDCPGDQRQTMRSGKEFSACMARYKVGQTVPVKVVHEWDVHGHYDWHVIDVGGCAAPPVDDDDSSFESVEDCVPSVQHDAVVGFHCNKQPEPGSELVAKCPWFKP
jgi:hypothetical protein